jgi:2-dehydro-3-deoxyphosphogalactonate aldolase
MNLHRLHMQGVPPVIAILRGVVPDEVIGIAEALVCAGVRIIEVPLNSPEPLESIRRLRQALGEQALIGAGTVLSVEAVEATYEAGARLIVTPNTDQAVIRQAVTRGMECMPGFFTPSEAFAAVAAGATRLKLFPAASSVPGHIRAIREVLPPATEIWAVGGTGAGNLAHWLEAGAAGIGVGSALYRRGDDAELVGTHARELVAAWEAATLRRPGS